MGDCFPRKNKLAARSFYHGNTGWGLPYQYEEKRDLGHKKANVIRDSLPLHPTKKHNMYAIVDIAGQQFKVQKDQRVYVHRLETEEGKSVVFDRILLLDDNGKVSVGAPVIKGAKVKAKVLKHLQDDKVIVFKKKRRKGYKVKNGHRQAITQIQIESIQQ